MRITVLRAFLRHATRIGTRADLLSPALSILRSSVAAAMLLGPTLLAGCASSPPAVQKATTMSEDAWPGLPNAARSGNVYFGGQPSRAALEHGTGQRLAMVINLRTPDEMRDRVDFDEAALLRDHGVRYVQIPMTATSLSRHDVAEFARALHSADGPVLVHCASSNRVGAMWAAYLIQERGYDPAEAVEHGQAAGMRAPALVEHVHALTGGGGG